MLWHHRRLSQDLRPAALDRLGLLPALEWLASDIGKHSGITVDVKTFGFERRLPSEVELTLFRIVQEVLRNVWRHSKASLADVALEMEQSKIRITVMDNGEGFNPPETVGELIKEGRLGLAGMHERVRLLNGSLIVRSKPGEGATVAIEAPV